MAARPRYVNSERSRGTTLLTRSLSAPILLYHPAVRLTYCESGASQLSCMPFRLRLAVDVLVEDDRSVDERQVVVVELREASEIGEEASALQRQAVRQRRRHDRRLLHLEALVVAVQDGIRARERIDRRGDPDLGGAEAEVASGLAAVRPNRIHDEPDRRVELRRERLVGGGERRLDAPHDAVGDVALDALLVRRRRSRRRWYRRRVLLGAQLLDQLLLLLHLFLQLLELALHGLEVALQLLDRGLLRGCRRHERGIMDVITRLNRERGLTVVLVSHHLRLVRTLVSTVVWVEDGVVTRGPTAELLAPERLASVFGT